MQNIFFTTTFKILPIIIVTNSWTFGQSYEKSAI